MMRLNTELVPCLVLVITGLRFAHSKQSIDCTKESSCKCRTKDGKVIDLSPLAKTDNTPRFKDITGGSDKYAWNPCNDFTLSEAGTSCSGVAACQTHYDIPGSLPSYFSLGTQNTATFVNDPSRGLELQYTGSDPSTTRASYVALDCDQTDEGSLTAKGEDPPGSAKYYMTLKSKHCCPSGGTGPTPTPGGGGGLSAGSVLVIIFFSLLFVYLVGGILFMKLVRNAQGLEMIPNEQFWCGLPGLIKDGFRLLFIDRCRRDTTYNKI